MELGGQRGRLAEEAPEREIEIADGQPSQNSSGSSAPTAEGQQRSVSQPDDRRQIIHVVTPDRNTAHKRASPCLCATRRSLEAAPAHETDRLFPALPHIPGWRGYHIPGTRVYCTCRYTGTTPRRESDEYVINSFRDKGTEDIFNVKSSRLSRQTCPEVLWKVARRKLGAINAAMVLKDLHVPPGNKLKALDEDRNGQHAIRINDQYRVCFSWTDAGAEQVEITDYH
jgi:proteic killer suppression protein